MPKKIGDALAPVRIGVNKYRIADGELEEEK